MKILILLTLLNLVIACDKSDGVSSNVSNTWGIKAPMIVKKNGNRVDASKLRAYDTGEALDEIRFFNQNRSIKLLVTTTCNDIVELNNSTLGKAHFIYTYLPKTILSKLEKDELLKCNLFFQATNSQGSVHKFELNLNIKLTTEMLNKFNLNEKLKFENGDTKENLNLENLVVEGLGKNIDLNCEGVKQKLDTELKFSDGELNKDCVLMYQDKDNDKLHVSNPFKIFKKLIAPTITFESINKSESFVHHKNFNLGRLSIQNNEDYDFKLFIKSSDIISEMKIYSRVNSHKKLIVSDVTDVQLRLIKNSNVKSVHNGFLINLPAYAKINVEVVGFIPQIYSMKNNSSLCINMSHRRAMRTRARSAHIIDFNFSLENIKLYPNVEKQNDLVKKDNIGMMFTNFKNLKLKEDLYQKIARPCSALSQAEKNLF